MELRHAGKALAPLLAAALRNAFQSAAQPPAARAGREQVLFKAFEVPDDDLKVVVIFAILIWIILKK